MRTTTSARIAMLLVALLAVGPVSTPSAAAASGQDFLWGSDISQHWSYDGAERKAAIDASRAAGMTVIYTDAKDGWGLAGWATPNYPTIIRFASGDGAVERVVKDGHAAGLHVAARFDLFEDHEAARALPHAAIGGNPAWTDPACPDVRARLMSQVKDLLQRTNVDELNLDHVRYPDTYEASSSARLPCTGGTLGDPRSGKDRTQVIASFVKEFSEAARSVKPDVVVSASVFGYTMREPLVHIGQDLDKMGPHLDVIMPMIYPSYYSSTAEKQPYETVYEDTARGVRKFGGSKIIPWVQGFGIYAGKTDPVCQQLKAAADAGAAGAVVWWFPSMGTSQTLWKSLTPCVPAKRTSEPAPTAPTPSTETKPFDATFRPKAGNSWWVETDVSANRDVARVTASVNGGSEIDLTLRSWGSWARSFHVPDAGHVRFAAYAKDGSRVASESAYVWPGATPVSSFEVTFRPKAGNAWWVETDVTANRHVSRVTASVNGGSEIDLTLRSWGSWARSFHVPEGSHVRFAAYAQDGTRVASPQAYVWPSATPVEPFAASFRPKAGNSWWVETDVSANRDVVRVTASVNGGSEIDLTLRSWGSWARSFHVPDGSHVRFAAYAQDGSKVTSPSPYRWPSATPV